MSGALSAFKRRNQAWQGVFAIGAVSLVVAALKAWWVSTPAPFQPLAIPPATAPMVISPAPPVIKPPASVSAVVGIVPPASSFTPSRIAPALLPPELSGLTRPPPDPPPFVPPVGLQPGYVIPENPEPRDIR